MPLKLLAIAVLLLKTWAIVGCRITGALVCWVAEPSTHGTLDLAARFAPDHFDFTLDLCLGLLRPLLGDPLGGRRCALGSVGVTVGNRGTACKTNIESLTARRATVAAQSLDLKRASFLTQNPSAPCP